MLVHVLTCKLLGGVTLAAFGRTRLREGVLLTLPTVGGASGTVRARTTFGAF